MKIYTVSIALLGLPAALAAVAATEEQPQDAQPTGPTPSQRLLGTGTQLKEPNSLYRSFLEKFWGEDKNTAEHAEQNLPHPGLEKRVAQKDQSSSTTASTLPLINTFTDLSSASAAAATPTITKLAVFTIEDLAWTITSAGGIEAVDGKTLTPGGPPINIGGHDISDPASGGVVIDGSSTLKFTRYIPPSSSSVAAGPGSSGPISTSASPSASASAAAGGSSSSSGGAAVPKATAGMGVVVGAIVGAIGVAVL